MGQVLSKVFFVTVLLFFKLPYFSILLFSLLMEVLNVRHSCLKRMFEGINSNISLFDLKEKILKFWIFYGLSLIGLRYQLLESFQQKHVLFFQFYNLVIFLPRQLNSILIEILLSALSISLFFQQFNFLSI